MSVFRAIGARLLPPRPRLVERESADLSTSGGDVDVEARLVAPPDVTAPLAVPGLLIEGTLPEDAFACFVLRLPREWNGGLVVAGSPGLLGERSLDLYWSDFCLRHGYAFACTDKGARLLTQGADFFVPMGPENRIGRWYPRLKALAAFSVERCAARYGRKPASTYAVGVSNGGYLARCAVERDPQLFAGAVDVSGVLWRADAPALLRDLPAALRAESPTPLELEYRFFHELTLQCLLADLDPEYAGPIDRYDVFSRPPALARVRELEITGRLRRPLASIAGGKDPLVPASAHAEAYARLVREAGCAALHTLTVVENASHVDGDRARHPWAEPLMPYAHAAFLLLARTPSPA